MVEAETVTLDRGLPAILELTESLYKHTVEAVVRRSGDDVKLFHDNVSNGEIKVIVLISVSVCCNNVTRTVCVSFSVRLLYYRAWSSHLNSK